MVHIYFLPAVCLDRTGPAHGIELWASSVLLPIKSFPRVPSLMSYDLYDCIVRTANSWDALAVVTTHGLMIQPRCSHSAAVCPPLYAVFIYFFRLLAPNKSFQLILAAHPGSERNEMPAG